MRAVLRNGSGLELTDICKMLRGVMCGIGVSRGDGSVGSVCCVASPRWLSPSTAGCGTLFGLQIAARLSAV